ncbi:hypothetical protein [Pseudonocardia thermophila]|uniref:hypothetical protein n=1 Tax=Pseudonocardia thermophila TaxID=1848 RepID=UPI000935B8FF|nr:hypothetical protein [Pseudonocardia thermophila]
MAQVGGFALGGIVVACSPRLGAADRRGDVPRVRRARAVRHRRPSAPHEVELLMAADPLAGVVAAWAFVRFVA